MAQFPFKSLRAWLDFLEEKGLLVHNKEEVDIKGDISAIARKLSQIGNKRGSSPAVVHENVRGYPGWRVATSTLNTYEQFAMALGEEKEGLLEAIAPRLDVRVPPMQVSTGPCKQIKMIGDEVDLLKIPHPFTGAYDGIPNITAGMSGGRFDLALPKFTIEFETALIGILEKLGVTFAGEDLSRIFSDGATGLSSIKHKTFVQVDEEGTEAAGVTAIITVDSIPPQVRCNRPFLFVIHEKNSETILFMGKVADPEDG